MCYGGIGGIMSDISPQQVYFFVAIFYSLDERTRSEFSKLLDTKVLDLALHWALKRGLLPEWSANGLYFDALYCTLGGLRLLLREAQFRLLVRLDGTEFRYHLDQVSEKELAHMLKGVSLKLEEVRELALKIQPVIDEAREKRQKFIAGRTE